MLRARMIWVGKVNRRDPETQLCERYAKRLQPYLKLEELVIKPLARKGADTSAIQQWEAEKILASLKPDEKLVACDERGKQWSSAELGGYLKRCGIQSWKPVFLIGGAMGLADQVRNRADFLLSFSKMTLPHALARVMLMEQLYRASCINAGHPYHHEG
jgi:23S rRNA (pseudouridine1915-N3)-methyltransferase